MLPITPKTKVGDLLKAYPELEDVLIDISPAFNKLRNPVLRRTVARVATLQQAALTGDVPINEIISRLREAVGQDVDAERPDMDWKGETPPSPPQEIVQRSAEKTIDAGPLIDAGQNPLPEVVGTLKALESGEMLVLTAPFYPAPLVDTIRPQCSAIWAHSDENTWRLWLLK